MSTNKFLTTRTTTLASLSAVAYGSSAFFSFTQDQIRGSNPLYDINRSRPSALMLDMLGYREVFIETAEKVIKDLVSYKRLAALYPEHAESSTEFTGLYLNIMLRELDNLSKYTVGIPSFLGGCLEIAFTEASQGLYALDEDQGVKFAQLLIDEAKLSNSDMTKLVDILLIIFASPETKLSDAPSDKALDLQRGLSTDYNHKGLTRSRVEIPIWQWQRNYTYRDMRGFQASAADLFMMENYDGYSYEQILSPEVVNGLGVAVLSELDVSYDVPQTNSRRLSPGEERVINFDLVNSPVGAVEV